MLHARSLCILANLYQCMWLTLTLSSQFTLFEEGRECFAVDHGAFDDLVRHGRDLRVSTCPQTWPSISSPTSISVILGVIRHASRWTISDLVAWNSTICAWCGTVGTSLSRSGGKPLLCLVVRQTRYWLSLLGLSSILDARFASQRTRRRQKAVLSSTIGVTDNLALVLLTLQNLLG